MAQEQLFADEYKVNLDVFEGPLDLLLYLIRREELDIYDIPIEHITAEYMKFIEEARRLDLDIAGEFIVMAATLMVIKSRMLLPVSRRTAEEGDEDDWVDPRLDLVRQLVEYKKFKDAAIRLETMEALSANSFDYGGGRPKFEKTAADALGALANLDLYDLLTAFQEVLARANELPNEELKGVRFSVPDKMDYVLERTRREGTGLLPRALRSRTRAEGRDHRHLPRAPRAAAAASRDHLPERRVPRDHNSRVEGATRRPAIGEARRL